MTAYEVDLRDAGVVVEALGEKFVVAATAGLRLAAIRGLRVLTTQIIPSRIPHPPVDRGVYRAAWKTASIPGGAEIYNDEPHAKFIEFGVRASNVKIGRAMIAALTEWVIRKRIEKDPDKARSIAWAIARSAQSKSGLAFFAGPHGSGFRILHELTRQQLPGIIREEVERQLKKVRPR